MPARPAPTYRAARRNAAKLARRKSGGRGKVGDFMAPWVTGRRKGKAK